MSTRRQKKEKLLRLQKIMDRNRQANKLMSHDELVAKENKHAKLALEREKKRKLTKMNKQRRLMRWRKRKAEKEAEEKYAN